MRYQRKTFKRITAAILAVSLAAALGGCTDTLRENQIAYKTIGINALAKGDYDEALDAFDRALEQSVGVVGSEEVDICYYKARTQYESGDTEGALDTLDALVDFDDSLGEAYFLRGNIYLDQGMDAEALSDYEAAVTRRGKDLELYIAICQNLSNTGHLSEGNDFLVQATQISGSRAEDHALRGRAYALLGQREEAMQELDKAIDEGSIDAKLYMGQLLTESGDLESAKPLFESYLSEKGEDADALNALGCMALQSGDYQVALDYFEQALACAEESGVDPREILKNRILAYEYNGQFENAKLAMEEYAAQYDLDAEFEKEYTFLSTR